MRRLGLLLPAAWWLGLSADASAQSPFQIGIDPRQVKSPAETGRVLLILYPTTDFPGRRPRGNEPRFQLGSTGL